MDEFIEQLRNLPKHPTILQGGIFPWPHLVRGEGGQPFRPLVPLWTEAESGHVYTDTLLAPDEDPFRATLEGFYGFIEKVLDSQACPTCLKVRDPELAQYLRDNLADTGIDVQLTDHLPELDAAVASMVKMVEAQGSDLPGLLDSRGVTIGRIRSFADAAAAFYRAAPWRWLSDTDLIQVETPKPPRGMAFLVVLGAGRNTFGLALYPSRVAYDRFLRASRQQTLGPDIAGGLSQVIFDTVEDLPLADAALWNEHQLPVAGDRAYPLVMRYVARGDVKRPSKRDLAFLAGLLRALGGSSEAEIDSGRWSKEVITDDGPGTFTLTLPDLLDPPSPQEWIKRGFAPDRRAHERVFADMHRYLQTHPPTGEEGLESINRQFAGRSLDDPLTQPRSPSERAQDLCFQAFDTYGRRRVLLARQALELDPDCGDAHVILAEQSGTLEDEIDHYRRGMQAAERSLGSECFTDDVGHFWGISETRPYMRARFGLAESLAAAGQLDAAIEHYQELLRLNPSDNQGVRYVLLPKLLAAGRDVLAARLLKEFDDDSANWAYARALLAFRLSGKSAATDRELREAVRTNLHVPELLCSEAPIPQPPHYAPGSFEEACVAADELRPAFRATPGAVDWIVDVQTRRAKKLDESRREQRRKERTKNKKRKRR